MRGLLLFAIAALAASCAPTAVAQPFVPHGMIADPPTPIPDLVLQNVNGGDFRFTDLRGRVLLLYFGFTACPDLCPVTLADLSQVKKRLGPDASRVEMAFVTVDPERDSPSVISRYVALFGSGIFGLTGTAEQLDAARGAFGVSAKKVDLPTSQLGYTVDHSALIYVVDQEGKLVEAFPYRMPIDDIVSDVRVLVQKGKL